MFRRTFRVKLYVLFRFGNILYSEVIGNYHLTKWINYELNNCSHVAGYTIFLLKVMDFIVKTYFLMLKLFVY